MDEFAHAGVAGSAQPQNLSLVEVEGHRLLTPDIQARHRQQARRAHGGAPRPQGDDAAEHGLAEGLGGRGQRTDDLNDLPIAHDRDAIAQVQGLVEPVRDEQDGAVPARSPACREPQIFGLARVEGRAHLVDDHELTRVRQQAHHLDQPPIRLLEITQAILRVQGATGFDERTPRGGHHLCFREVLHIGLPEHGLGHVHGRVQAELLLDDADLPGFQSSASVVSAAGIRRQRSCQDGGERGLTHTVAADQAHDLAGAQFQVNAAQDFDAAKRLRDAFDGDRVVGRIHRKGRHGRSPLSRRVRCSLRV